MAKKKISRAEATFGSLLKGLWKDPDDKSLGFKDNAPVPLKITTGGQLIGKERSEQRISINGVVFLHVSSTKMIKVSGRDISPTGIGIEIDKKVKSYQVGSKLGLEFAQPHKLQGLLFNVELRRVHVDGDGRNQIGFKIISSSKHLRRRLGEYLNYLRSDPWSV